MATACITQVRFRFEPKDKPVVAAFDISDSSSDGGLVLLKGIDTHLGLTKRLVTRLDDDRQPAKGWHQTIELLRQQVFGIAGGYADCNDAARRRDSALSRIQRRRTPSRSTSGGDPWRNPFASVSTRRRAGA